MIMIKMILSLLFMFLGRQLFWLFVGGIGFVYGMEIAVKFFPQQADWVTIVGGLILGLVGLLVAIFLQRVAVAVIGFLAGMFIAFHLSTTLNLSINFPLWLFLISGGIIGLILIFILFDWTLIIVSSMLGAFFIVQNINLNEQVLILIFTILMAAGVAVQGSMLLQQQKKK